MLRSRKQVNVMILGDEEIGKIQNGEWEIDCPQMILAGRREGARRYAGPGWIKQGPNGCLIMKLYDQSRPRSETMTFGSGSAGTVVPEEDYYDLEALDAKGRTWHAKKILPDITWSAGGRIVEAKLFGISASDTLPIPLLSRAFLCFEVFQAIDIPCNAVSESSVSVAGQRRSQAANLDVARFSSSGIDFELRTGTNRLTVEVVAPGQHLPEFLEMRVGEALQFVLARPIWWSVLQAREGNSARVEIRRLPGEDERSHMPVPIDMRRYYQPAPVWSLCKQYFRFVSAAPGPDWHPLSVLFRLVIDATVGPWDARALALGVSVEGALRAGFESFGLPTPEFLQEIEKAKRLISGSDLSKEVRDRLGGALNNMGGFHAGPALKRLAEQGVIPPELVRAWKKLRNRFAHAEQARSMLPQELMNLCYSVTTLLYRLIFAAIGYVGPFTDYSIPTWPMRHHGAAASPVAPQASSDNGGTPPASE